MHKTKPLKQFAELAAAGVGQHSARHLMSLRLVVPAAERLFRPLAELAAPIADNAALFRRIVFTGGPSGGKTSVIEILQRHFGARVAAVPEAATIL